LGEVETPPWKPHLNQPAFLKQGRFKSIQMHDTVSSHPFFCLWAATAGCWPRASHRAIQHGADAGSVFAVLHRCGCAGALPFVVSLGHRLAAWLFIWGVEMVSGGTYCGELVSHWMLVKNWQWECQQKIPAVFWSAGIPVAMRLLVASGTGL